MKIYKDALGGYSALVLTDDGDLLEYAVYDGEASIYSSREAEVTPVRSDEWSREHERIDAVVRSDEIVSIYDGYFDTVNAWEVLRREGLI